MSKVIRFPYSFFVIKLLCVIGLLVSSPFSLAAGQAKSVKLQEATNPIIFENRNLGSENWQIGKNGNLRSDDVDKQILGYANASSVNKGEKLNFKITVNPPQQFTIEIYRMGWYGGKGARLMGKVGPLGGISQPDCPMDPVTGLIECKWSTSYTLNVPTNWTSGIYLAVLTNASKYQSQVTFVVRDDGRVSDILYQQPILTYAAYNNFPADGRSGKSLYLDSSFGANTISSAPRAVKVSLDRPDSVSDFSGGSYSDSNYYWEIYLVRWLEQQGYDVSYSTNIDVHQNPDLLNHYKAFISAGHDEYWSGEIYRNVTVARDKGVSLAFLGGNSVYWQVRLEPSSSGEPNRVIVCYRDASIDPEPAADKKTITFRDLGKPEQTLLGIQSTGGMGQEGRNAELVPKNTSSWVYSDTGVSPGTSLPGLVGHEVDRIYPDLPMPISRTYTILSESPYQEQTEDELAQSSSIGKIISANSVIYQAQSGAWVFSAGSLGWVWGLNRPGYESYAIKKMLENIFNRMLSDSLIKQKTNPETIKQTNVEEPVTILPTVVASDDSEIQSADSKANPNVIMNAKKNDAMVAGLSLMDIGAILFGVLAGGMLFSRIVKSNSRNRRRPK